MAPDKNGNFSLEELSLAPLEDALVPEQAQRPNAGKYFVERRSGKERRTHADRRQEFRFSEDRRSGRDRRPVKGWVSGKNL